MPRTASSSSSASADDRLVRIPLGSLHPHPANPNVMEPATLAKLRANILLEERYPPIIARPHPTIPHEHECLDGAQRLSVLRDLGHEDALCYVWECDDATALRLLAS